jgi:3-oxoacyl-[acyl-carrier-protein] synthase II
MSRRVVITGLGVVACCGEGKDAFWAAVRDGRSGVSHLDSFEVSDLACQIGGQVRGFDPLRYIDPKKARKQGRFVHFSVAAARQAFEDSGLEGSKLSREQYGVSFGSSGAGFGNLADDGYKTVLEHGIKELDAGVINEVPAHAATSHIAIDLGLKGPTLSASTGCVTAVVTLSQGFEAIRNGQAKVMIAGASEACLSRFVFGLLCRQRVMSTRNEEPAKACRPFDKERDGLVLGEGAAAVVLETAEHAMDRGARIYGEMVGYGLTCEAFHMVISLPTGEELARALGQALAMARVSPTEVDYACAHGIGNKQYDVADTRGLQQALGAHAYRIPVSSIKPVTAQPFAACAAMQTVAVAMGFATDTVPPTINYQTPDEECDLDYVPNVARRARVDTAVLNAHSFGGTHGALVLRRFA